MERFRDLEKELKIKTFSKKGLELKVIMHVYSRAENKTGTTRRRREVAQVHNRVCRLTTHLLTPFSFRLLSSLLSLQLIEKRNPEEAAKQCCIEGIMEVLERARVSLEMLEGELEEQVVKHGKRAGR
jgi:CCR4-NOT transcriptional regulation complex NOT5 subunit